MQAAMPPSANTPSPCKPCSCASAGQHEPDVPSSLVDKLSVFVFGERLSGIELVELCGLVVAVLSVLVLGVLGLNGMSHGGCHGGAKGAQSDMIAIVQEAEMYRLEHGHFPDSLVRLVENGDLRKYPVDPWGTDYQAFARPDGNTFFVRSAGPDRVHGTSDDVFNPYNLE
jgi:competence protein ComGC